MARTGTPKHKRAKIIARAAATPQPQAVASSWIISPFWDSVLFIGAPLTSIITLYPLRVFWSPQEYAFLLLAFFTFGHHLPGFIRAYGDRELFARFRWRFLLFPPLVFGTTLWFDLNGLHGLVIFVFAWDIWHVLMQHYGFMRIYDAKRGEIHALTARIDWAISISWYLSLIVASPHYRHNLLYKAYASGVPLVSADLFRTLEIGLYTLTGVLTAAYILYNLYLWKNGRFNLRKLTLLATFWFASYFLYVHVDDFVVGFAVWSAFHCIQYYGIVWVFNQGRVIRRSPMTRFVQFLFRPRLALVLLYLGLIAAYGGINYLLLLEWNDTFRHFLLAFVATSNVLHYYYDGFIWKVRERDTRQYLNIDDAETTAARSAVSIGRAVKRLLPTWKNGLVQAGYLAGIVILLALLETWRPNEDLAVRQSLAAVAPEAEEAHLEYGEALRQANRLNEAAQAYREAVRVNPVHAEAYINLGVALAELGQIDEAITAYERALAINSSLPVAHFNLAGLLASRGNTQRALASFQEALQGDDPDVRQLARSAIARLQQER